MLQSQKRISFPSSFIIVQVNIRLMLGIIHIICPLHNALYNIFMLFMFIFLLNVFSCHIKINHKRIIVQHEISCWILSSGQCPHFWQ